MEGQKILNSLGGQFEKGAFKLLYSRLVPIKTSVFNALTNRNETVCNLSRNIVTLELYTKHRTVRTVGNTVEKYILLNIS